MEEAKRPEDPDRALNETIAFLKQLKVLVSKVSHAVASSDPRKQDKVPSLLYPLRTHRLATR